MDHQIILTDGACVDCKNITKKAVELSSTAFVFDCVKSDYFNFLSNHSKAFKAQQTPDDEEAIGCHRIVKAQMPCFFH